MRVVSRHLFEKRWSDPPDYSQIFMSSSKEDVELRTFSRRPSIIQKMEMKLFVNIVYRRGILAQAKPQTRLLSSAEHIVEVEMLHSVKAIAAPLIVAILSELRHVRP